MDKNFIVAILISTLIIIIYASPQYQKRFGKLRPEQPVTEQAVDERTAVPQVLKAPASNQPAQRSLAPVQAPVEKETVEQTVSDSAIVQVDSPGSGSEFTLENEDILLTFSSRGGVIAKATLKEFDGAEEDVPVQLITDGESWYNGYIQEGETYLPFTDIVFNVQTVSKQRAVLTAEMTDGRTVKREFTLDPTGYLLNAKTDLSSAWVEPTLHYAFNGPIAQTELAFKKIKIWPFSMFMRDDNLTYQKLVYLGDGNRQTIINGDSKTKNGGKRIFPKEDHSQKIDGNKSGEGEDTFVGELNWYAVRNKYFITIAIPNETVRWGAYSRFTNTAGKKWFDFSLSKKVSDGNTDLNMYIGPMSYDTLKSYGSELTEAMELSFRFIRPISILFLWLFKKLHTFISNWGLVIILFSFIIKLVLYPLSKKSYDSMRKMSALQPQITVLKEKYKNNPQNLQKATMELYKQEGVNPFSGCLPTLLQMPVFFALYPVVGRAFELRQAMFIPYWIEDLSRPDPFYILPIAMGISMFFQSKTTMKDPSQKPMLYMMPVMMVVLFANFSSGLTLYWFLFNITSFLQQKLHSS